jgi:chemotaxis protein MotB
MSRSSKKRHLAEYEEGWLMTYADMITLLLCVFLIMLSVSQPELKKLKEIEKQLRSQFGNTDSLELINDLHSTAAPSPFFSIMESFNGVLKDTPLLQDVFIKETEKGVVIEVNSAPMFVPGSAKLSKEGTWFVDQLASTLVAFGFAKYIISIEGHTDNTPVGPNGQFPSNWELSAARASSVVRRLIDQGVGSEYLRVVGYGDTQPVRPNEDALGRPLLENQAKNRRVVIRVEKKY